MKRTATSLIAVLAATLVAAGAAAPRAQAGAGLSRSERAIIRLVNDIRSYYGLNRLRASRSLSNAADQHSRDMLGRDFFDHSSSDGTSFASRVRRYTNASRVGETLAALSPHSGGAATVVRMWMESPPHRAVLLASGFGRIGLARRWGMLGGAWQAVVTADFASLR
jgi:uncharacterized protein YkwD